MISQQKPKGCMEFLKAGQDAVVISVTMVYHITKMKNRIQRQGVKYFNTAVKLGKRKPVLADAAGWTIAILAIGEHSYPYNSLVLGIRSRDIKQQQKDQ
jgi:hypothetical protein